MVFGAWLHRIPVVSYESDLTPGLANKICKPFVKKIATTFPECAEALGKKAIGKGVVGEIDDMEVIKVPKSRFPEGVNFMIVHKSAACMPIKIEETKIHQDPPGISGNLLEGRQYYDCFVFDKLKHGIYVDKTTA